MRTSEIQQGGQISPGGWSCPRICPGMGRKTDRLQSIAFFPPLRAYTMFVRIRSIRTFPDGVAKAPSRRYRASCAPMQAQHRERWWHHVNKEALEKTPAN